jgi:micrococcal nuclease
MLLSVRLFTFDGSRRLRIDSEAPRHVIRTIDGRNLLLEGNVHVRLLGVSAAEAMKPDSSDAKLAREAADFVRTRVAGRDVTLQFDRERLDPAGRLMAYVYVDSLLLNEELIRGGFSRIESPFNLERTMATRLRRAEAEARNAGRGIWRVAQMDK